MAMQEPILTLAKLLDVVRSERLVLVLRDAPNQAIARAEAI
jgi:hypothetical protein